MLSIGLIVAMPEEVEHMYSALGKLVSVRDENGFKISTYSNGDKKIYLIGSGIGEINAALATQYLILNYDIDYIINFGVVGSLNKKYKCLDVVVVDEIVHYDFSLNTMDPSSYGKYPFQRDKAEFDADRKMIDIVKSIEPNIGLVKIASGDKFVANPTLRNWIIDTFKADICDMESMGIYYAANKYNVPCLFIKAVSDDADSDAPVSFEKVVENGVNAYVKLVAKILEKL